MSQNENGPQVLETPRDRNDQAAGGSRSAVTVAHDTDRAQQGDALFPGDDSLPVARPVPVQTSGRLEFAARCPSCGDWHRHVGLGEKDAPCGAHYVLEFKNKIKGAA